MVAWLVGGRHQGLHNGYVYGYCVIVEKLLLFLECIIVKLIIIVIWKHTVEAPIHCTTFQCCYIDTAASQHLFAALQAVTAKTGCMAQSHHCPLHLPSSLVSEPRRFFFFWELWVWAHISVEAGRQGAGPMVVEGHKGAVGWWLLSDRSNFFLISLFL